MEEVGQRGWRVHEKFQLRPAGVRSHQSTKRGPISPPPNHKKVTEGRREGDDQIERLRKRKGANSARQIQAAQFNKPKRSFLYLRQIIV